MNPFDGNGMTRKSRSSQTAQRPGKRKGRAGGILLVAVVAGALGLTAWSAFGPKGETSDPNVVVNLTSMMGRQAPEFTLADSEGTSYTITPGDGRKFLLIFHMGSV